MCVWPSFLTALIGQASLLVVTVDEGQRGNAHTVVVVASKTGLSPVIVTERSRPWILRARGEQHVNNVSFSEKKILIRALTKPKLQRDDYHLLSRKQQVILVRLRTGHNRLNSHMHRKLKLAPSPTFPCGREEQTVEHVLQRCPLYEATREDVWPVSTSLTTKLYGCKQDLEKTTSFISRAALIV